MRNRIIFLFFLAAMLSFGINNAKAQSFTIDYDGYSLGFTVISTNEVSVRCSTKPSEPTELNIPSEVVNDGNTYIVTTIAQNAFYNTKFEGDLIIPNTITDIGPSAFRKCSGLSGKLYIHENIQTISSKAFMNTGFTSVEILSEYITEIPDEAFSGCEELSEAIIPNQIESIGSSAFLECYMLESIELPEELTTIGNNAFEYSGLTEIKFNKKLKSIGESAFSSCEFIENISIPGSVKTIKGYAFSGCTNLKTLKCNNETPPTLYRFAFDNHNSDFKIYVPATSVITYKQKAYWSSYKDYIVGLPVFINDGDMNEPSNWEPNEIPAPNVDVFINANGVIYPSKSITLNSFEMNEFGSITIEEGGQLIHNGSEDAVTVKKSINPYVIGEDGYLESGWYTISSPFGDLQLSSSNFINNNYELFRYNETIYEWENHKNPEHVNDFTTLEAGRGYIYANATETNISITEVLNTERKTYKMTASSDILKGFNLVGNPFMHNIYKGSGCAIDNGNLAEGFYTLSNEGAWHVKHNEAIKPMESILVKTTTAGTLYINKKTNSSAARALNNGLVTIEVSNEKHNDVAYVTFNGGIGLDKINHRNSNIPMVYIPMDNVNYAIAVMDKEVTEIPVNFEAMTMGEYTISVSSTACNYDEITLIDKQNGQEINMLTGDYKFLATTNDNPERFLIKVSINENDEAEFFTDGSNIIINDIEGSGVVQIYDVMGRMIIKQNTSGSNCQISSTSMANGIYVISLTDDNGTTTKKILINNK